MEDVQTCSRRFRPGLCCAGRGWTASDVRSGGCQSLSSRILSWVSGPVLGSAGNCMDLCVARISSPSKAGHVWNFGGNFVRKKKILKWLKFGLTCWQLPFCSRARGDRAWSDEGEQTEADSFPVDPRQCWPRSFGAQSSLSSHTQSKKKNFRELTEYPISTKNRRVKKQWFLCSPEDNEPSCSKHLGS